MEPRERRALEARRGEQPAGAAGQGVAVARVAQRLPQGGQRQHHAGRPRVQVAHREARRGRVGAEPRQAAPHGHRRGAQRVAERVREGARPVGAHRRRAAGAVASQARSASASAAGVAGRSGPIARATTSATPAPMRGLYAPIGADALGRGAGGEEEERGAERVHVVGRRRGPLTVRIDVARGAVADGRVARARGVGELEVEQPQPGARVDDVGRLEVTVDEAARVQPRDELRQRDAAGHERPVVEPARQHPGVADLLLERLPGHVLHREPGVLAVHERVVDGGEPRVPGDGLQHALLAPQPPVGRGRVVGVAVAVGALEHAQPQPLEVHREEHGAARGRVERPHAVVAPREHRRLGRHVLGQAGGLERVDDPVRRLVPRQPAVRHQRSVRGLHGRQDLAGRRLREAPVEPAVAVGHEPRGVQTPVRGDARPVEAAGGAVELARQRHGGRIVGRVDGQELPDLRQPAGPLVQPREEPGVLGDLEGGTVALQHGQHRREHRAAGRRRGADAQLPALAGQRDAGGGADPQPAALPLDRVGAEGGGEHRRQVDGVDRASERVGGHGTIVRVTR
ncbi:MAG: hypothetical protein R3F59_12855 [Myxococcota bacterium]